MENLAPAGNWDALRSAVAAGADAVYLGYAAYSARAGAGNFDVQQLRDAVRFAHLHHVRVHVTVNTLIKDGEMAGVVDVLRLLSEIRVDAVLVQDLGVLRMARRCFPDLPIHASTQMAIHNATGVRFCRNQGMTRACLPANAAPPKSPSPRKRASKSKCSGMARSALLSAGSACSPPSSADEAATAGAALSLAACCIPTAARPRRGSLRAMCVCATTCRS